MAVEMAVDCVLQACDAVAEAHSLGIVHRDLKPRNLFLTQRNDGRSLVKVLDFGISKDRTGVDLGLTGTAEIIGSPNYMSPEQLRSTKAADERSDIWALGVILYELLTGAVPFLAQSITELTAVILTDPPRPIAQLRSDLPPTLERAVERCLEKEPGRRFASVAEVAAALEPFAPPDTRELAGRIARITAGKRPPGAPARGAAGSALPDRTTGTWTDRSGVSHAQRKSVALATTGFAALVAVAAAGTLALVRQERSTKSRDPTPASREGAGIVTADASSVASVAPAVLAPLPSASALGGPTAPIPPVAPVREAASAAQPVHGTSPPKGKPEPATTASTNEAPKFRTPW
jgi:serine/threonine-protein kinase